MDGGSLKIAFASDLVVDRQPCRAQRTQNFVENATDRVCRSLASLLDPSFRVVDLSFALVLDEIRHRHFVQRRGLLVLDALPGNGRRAHFRWRLCRGEAGTRRLRGVEPRAG